MAEGFLDALGGGRPIHPTDVNALEAVPAGLPAFCGTVAVSLCGPPTDEDGPHRSGRLLPGYGSRCSVMRALLPGPGSSFTSAWPRAFWNLPVPPVTASWNVLLDPWTPAASIWPCLSTKVA